jgi:flagellar biosynthesis/type III secretory pathway protein FliH
MRDKIIKSADIHARLKVRSHDFPDFTAGHDAPGGLFFKKNQEFKPEIFSTDKPAEVFQKEPSVSSATPSGNREKAASADDGNASIRHLLRQVQQAIVAMETVAGDVDRQMERTVGLLALGLAEIMINHAAETNPDVVLGSLSKALQKGQGQAIRKIRLNPADMEQTTASRKKLSNLVEHMDDLRLEPDAALSRGGCLVETDYGTIDATPDNQFRVLMETFRSAIGTAATVGVQATQDDRR